MQTHVPQPTMFSPTVVKFGVAAARLFCASSAILINGTLQSIKVSAVLDGIRKVIFFLPPPKDAQ